MAIQMIISGNDIPLLPETKGHFERIISLLEQGEENKKYKQIVEKMKNKYDVWVSLPGYFTNLTDYINDIEREVRGE